MEQTAQTQGIQDMRWALRATADVLLQGGLIRLVSSSPDYPGLIKQLGSARHVRAPVCGRFASWAEDRQNQCTARTSQRAQSAWRHAVLPSLRFECVELIRSLTRLPEAGVELNQHQLQSLLELQGWNVSHVVRNQVLGALVDEGYLASRRCRELVWYRPGANSGTLAEVDVRAGHVSRWLGMLTSTVAQRLYQEPGILSAMDLSLPKVLVQKFANTFSQEAKRLAWERATLRGDDLVWFRFSLMSGEQAEPVEVSHLLPSVLPLIGDLSHIIGEAGQAEDVFRRYLAEVLDEYVWESTEQRDARMAQYGILNGHTLARWKGSPLLLDPAAEDTFDGGSVGVIVREMLWELSLRWPKPTECHQLVSAIKRRMVRNSSNPAMVELALAHLRIDPRVRNTQASDTEEFVWRERVGILDRPKAQEILGTLRMRLRNLPEQIFSAVGQNASDTMIYGDCIPMQRDAVAELVKELKEIRKRLFNEILSEFNAVKDTMIGDAHSEESHSVLLQGCFTPISIERIWNR